MKKSAYHQIIERIFADRHRPGVGQVAFTRDDLVAAATELNLPRPKNLGDIVYTFRFRQPLPESIRSTAPAGREWIIRQQGDALYSFVHVEPPRLKPSSGLLRIHVPDATPGLIARYALDDEQALLAVVRYNRLIDIFTGVACSSLQNHLRTKVRGLGQVETDEVYVGVDRRGAHFVFPIQAKGGRDRHSIVQIEQDLAMCAHKFPALICRPIAVQFLDAHSVAMLEFIDTPDGLRIAGERHYALVPQEQITDDELRSYRQAAGETA